MRTKLTRRGKVWEWAVYSKGRHVLGGYCRTKRDAANDAAIAKAMPTHQRELRGERC